MKNVPPTDLDVSRPCLPEGFRMRFRKAFTLVELLAVISIILILMALVIPAINAIKGGSDVTKAAYDIAGTLEQARTYAMANNTYVWVGFYEEDGSQTSTNPATTGMGRVIMSVVASKDGTRYSDTTITSPKPAFFGNETTATASPSNLVQLVQLNKLIKVESIHMTGVNDPTTSSNNVPVRPSTALDYQVGDAPATSPNPSNDKGLFTKHPPSFGSTDVYNPTSFSYPLQKQGSAARSGQYIFYKIIEFNAQGQASKICTNVYSGSGGQNTLEIAFQPTHGNIIDPRYTGNNQSKAAAAIQIDGLTGRVTIFRL